MSWALSWAVLLLLAAGLGLVGQMLLGLPLALVDRHRRLGPPNFQERVPVVDGFQLRVDVEATVVAGDDHLGEVGPGGLEIAEQRVSDDAGELLVTHGDQSADDLERFCRDSALVERLLDRLALVAFQQLELGPLPGLLAELSELLPGHRTVFGEGCRHDFPLSYECLPDGRQGQM